MTESKRKHMVLLLLLMIIPMIILGSINVVSAADRSDATYDEVLANFRNVRAGRIGRNNLYLLSDADRLCAEFKSANPNVF